MLLDIYLGLHSAIEGRTAGPEYVLYKFPAEESLKLQVVGTCGDCENTGSCDIETFIFRSPDYTDSDDFGCTHFEKKK